jgi:hypothetical protein
MVVFQDSLALMANKGIGAAFVPAILQIPSPWFDCTMRSLSRSPNQDGRGPHFDPSILRIDFARSAPS